MGFNFLTNGITYLVNGMKMDLPDQLKPFSK